MEYLLKGLIKRELLSVLDLGEDIGKNHQWLPQMADKIRNFVMGCY